MKIRNLLSSLFMLLSVLCIFSCDSNECTRCINCNPCSYSECIGSEAETEICSNGYSDISTYQNALSTLEVIGCVISPVPGTPSITEICENDYNSRASYLQDVERMINNEHCTCTEK